MANTLSHHRRELSIGATYLALLIAIALVSPNFFRAEFFSTWIRAAPVLVAAIGMTLVIIAREIDVSIGSQFSVCGVLAALLAKAGMPLPLAAACTVGCGALLGAVNGLFVAFMGLPSIVVTLATMVILRESLRLAREGEAVRDLPANFQWFGASQHVGQWLLIALALIAVAIAAIVSRYWRAGRAVYAVGSDSEAARLAGLRPRRITFDVFMIMGALVGLAALMNAVRFPQTDVNAGLGLELQVIAAVVVGGAAISGGRGTQIGTLLGVALLVTIGPALTFFHLAAQWERAVQGAIILIAVASDSAFRAKEAFTEERRRMTSTPAISTAALPRFRRRAAMPLQQRILAILIIVELIVFACIARRFLSIDNLFTILPLNVELGLVALALTPIIVSGGIDLSVGSTLGLCAVCFGKLNRDLGWSFPAAIVATLLLGIICGGMNALFIARFRVAPLIATLGTYSLYRGIAEGMTGGVANYTDFHATFLRLGQGTFLGVPMQLYIFALAIVFFYLLQHRAVLGRALVAIGFAPEGARYAGINVERSLSIAYVLSGLMSAIAAVIYVARVGQAKADAGNGYELSAITAVVLGGTSIFGGRGSIIGTLMGLLAIALLENGLRLADLSPELAGILRGVLLLAAIGIDWRPSASTTAKLKSNETNAEEFEMRNGQLAVLCAVIILAAAIVTGGNFLLVKQMRSEPTQVSLNVPEFSPQMFPRHANSETDVRAEPLMPSTSAPANPVSANHLPDKPLTIAMMPKSKGNAYFISCRKGAEEAAGELHDTLLWDGPTDAEPAKQNEIVDTWITRGVDAIAVSVDNRDGLSTALRKARAAGIKVITWDADALPDARDFFVNQATAEGIGDTLMDNAAKAMGGSGEFAIITASLTSANQNEWIGFVKKQMADRYPQIKLDTIEPCDDLQPKAFEQARTIMNAYPNVKLIMAVCSPAVPGAAEAVKQAGREKDVKVVGLGLPNDNKPYVHAGITTGVVLWNTTDLGYLAVETADQVVRGKLKAGDASITAGRLGKIEVKGDNVMLGTPFTFDATNIDRFDF